MSTSKNETVHDNITAVVVTSESASERDTPPTCSWSPSDEARIRRRLDCRLLPLVFAVYAACFIDRANIGNARIQGMATELHLVGFRFNWALTSFFIAYSAAVIPSNVVLKLLGGHIWIPCLVVSFGLCSMCTAFVKTYTGLLVARIFLGLAEGGMFGGLAFFLSVFYKRHELALRVAVLVVAAVLAGAFGGLLAAGLSQIPEWGSGLPKNIRLHSWRNIFFFEGLVTILLGVMAFFLLPANPETCKWLTKSDRFIATERIKIDNRMYGPDKVRLYHVYRAVFNINNTLCGLGMLCISISINSISLFMPTILYGFKWSPIKSQLYTVPPYAVGTVYTVIVCWLSDRTKKRGYFAILNSVISVVGFAILAAPYEMTSTRIKYTAVFFAAAGCFPSGPMFMVWAMNNAAGPTVRAITPAYIAFLAGIASFIAVWSYLPGAAPGYTHGHAINLGANALAIVLAILVMVYNSWENATRARGGRNYRLDGLTTVQIADLGYRHPEFRFTG